MSILDDLGVTSSGKGAGSDKLAMLGKRLSMPGTLGAKRKVSREAQFHLSKRETLDGRRSAVQSALDKMNKVANKKKNSGCMVGSYCYISELGLDKVVYTKDGKTYGADYYLTPDGDAKVTGVREVDTVYTAV